MTTVGTEGLALFEGIRLRDAAVDKHRTNHAEDIRRVRIALLVACEMGNLSHVTGDDVMAVVEQMGIPGDPRWTATVLKGWERVVPTDQFVPSKRKSRHAAPLRVWFLLPQEGV